MNNSFYQPPGSACAIEVPPGSVLGINYSGMHDTAIAIVSPAGKALFAVSLERLSRIKQDGRLPTDLLAGIPWQSIAKVAISVAEGYQRPAQDESVLHPLAIATPTQGDRAHAPAFQTWIATLPVDKEFVSHHLSHAASSFWGSGLDTATCLVYDGGMANEQWFGGVYTASRDTGIVPLDLFSAERYANVAHLYAVVTALLGFTPMKHEGKITGLAAYGKPTDACRAVFGEWLTQPQQLHGLFGWQDIYGREQAPRVMIDLGLLGRLRQRLAGSTREDIAATVQAIAEEQTLALLSAMRARGWLKDSVCLSGGLFANVKINQRVSEYCGRQVFVAPPMTDDGTAWGAALHVLSRSRATVASAIAEANLPHVYFGPSYRVDAETLTREGIVFTTPNDAAGQIAERLAEGKVVAIYQGASEFGPRALGNRSILAAADHGDINATLNTLLQRTEFMPFAPVVRAEDAAEYFDIAPGERHTARFMTLTVNCTDRAHRDVPAVVHVDGTARPQLLEAQDNQLMREVLARYGQLTGRLALVNTSFNIHEEPIVYTPEDALRGFFEAGLDWLYLEGHLIELAQNRAAEARYLRQKLTTQAEIIKHLKPRIPELEFQLRDHRNMVLEEKHHAWVSAQRAESAEEALGEMQRSHSWRITAPLRWLVTKFRRE